MINLALGHHVRQFLKGIMMSDDLYLKTHFPNHLANRTEKQAAAGAKLPKDLSRRLAYFTHLTHLSAPLLSGVLGELSSQVQVAYAHDDKITLALPTITSANHVRYLHQECLSALHEHPAFGQFSKMGVIVNHKIHQRVSGQITAPTTLEKPLSENTVRTITQTAKLVIKNPSLQASFIKLIQTAATKE
ncbi:hypothetical protein [Moraxella equi]|nr:hypothetical protein [Moraxella equi]